MHGTGKAALAKITLARREISTIQRNLIFSSIMNAEVQYITDDKGEKTGVIMNISDYQSLMEDVEDLAACAERRDEATIPHEEFLKELKEDGLL